MVSWNKMYRIDYRNFNMCDSIKYNIGERET